MDVENWYLIRVRNIKGHITPHHTVKYQLTTLFPTECGCNKDGSENDGCHTQTGMCKCKPGWYGKQCQKGMLVHFQSNY